MSMVYSGDSIQDTDGGVLRPISSVMRNRIINGAMVIDQRNAGASFTIPAALPYTLDRWQAQADQASKYSVEQTITGVAAPTGFTDYLGATSLSAYSVLAGDRFVIRQNIEGFNVADLGFGTVNAKTITISFWVRSSLTGNFGGYIANSAFDRSYPFSYTISAANTWEQKSVTIAGDTSGTWLTDNGVGMRLGFSLGVGSNFTGTGNAWASSQIIAPTGSVSVVGTSGATFYITGVQLEVGSQATSFEYRQYTTELQLCQRYYYKVQSLTGAEAFGFGYNSTTTSNRFTVPFPVKMRVAPTALEQSGTAFDYKIGHGTTSTALSVAPSFSALTSIDQASAFSNVASGLTAGQGSILLANTTSAYLAWSAEL